MDRKIGYIFYILLITTLLVEISSTAVYAGSINIDSLTLVLADQEDSKEKADNMFLVMRGYYREWENDSTLFYAEKLGKIAAVLDYKERQADAVYYKGLVSERIDKWNAAISFYREFVNDALSLGDTIRIAKGYTSMARILSNQGSADSAIYFLRETIRIGKNVEDPMLMLTTSNTLGNIYQRRNELDSATHYYFIAAKICEDPAYQKHLGGIYNNLGRTFTRLKQYDEALNYLNSGLDLNRNTNYQQDIILNYINLGFVYLFLSEYDRAETYFDSASYILKDYPIESIDIGNIYNGYSEIFEHRLMYDEALANLDKALAIFMKEKFQDGIIVALFNKGVIYTKTGRYQLAQQVLDSSYSIAVRNDAKDHRKEILWGLAENDYKRGNYKLAYDNYVRYHELNDTLFDIERSEKIADLNMKYNNERIQKENLALKNMNLEMELGLREKTNQYNLLLFVAISLVFLAVFLAIFLRQRIVISKHQIRQLEKEKKLLSARLLVEGQEQERKRIATELHDGLGVLLSATKIQFTSIKDITPENRPLIEKALQLLDQATGDVRKISQNMMPGLLTRLGIYEAVEDLLEDIRDSGELTVNCQVEPDLPRLPENREIMLFRIIQEWVNNTLKHADAKKIDFTLQKVNDSLIIDYSDDGKGYDVLNALQAKSKSIGLKSIQSRVDFLDGKMENNSAPGKGSAYHLRIKLQ